MNRIWFIQLEFVPSAGILLSHSGCGSGAAAIVVGASSVECSGGGLEGVSPAEILILY